MDNYTKLKLFVEKNNHYFFEWRWQDFKGYNEPQLVTWVSYYTLGDFVDAFAEYFGTEDEVKGLLQRGYCWINISELFDQENEELEVHFPKDESRKEGWIK